MSSNEVDLLPVVFSGAEGSESGRDQAIFGLESHATPPREWSLRDVYHAISNDDLAPVFDATANRVQSAEYQATAGRVAVTVGESALLASIRFIPEDTIILIDKSPAMIGYMAAYIQALRSSENMEEWYARMGLSGPDAEYPEYVCQRFRQVMGWQAGYWMRAGYDHPAVSDDAFETARDLASGKAIVPWTADIARPAEMGRLGKLLRAYDASVTMLNLTNVLVCDDEIRTASQAVRGLDALPFTSGAPIILTTEADWDENSEFAFTHPTRTFFGLDDLRDNGGITDLDSPFRGPAINPVVQA